MFRNPLYGGCGEVHIFGYGERWWKSGGSCRYIDGEIECNKGAWLLNKSYLPEELYPYADEMLAKFNANVSFGCCGGCE